jgi:hypothetical protein
MPGEAQASGKMGKGRDHEATPGIVRAREQHGKNRTISANAPARLEADDATRQYPHEGDCENHTSESFEEQVNLSPVAEDR